MTGADYTRAAANLVERYRDSVRSDFLVIPESRIWERPAEGQVSPANLVLHLSGNLRHFFGHLLGGSGYVRERDREFQEERHLTRAEILARWDGACEETKRVLLSLDDAALDREAALENYPGGAANAEMILRLLAHLSYHAGQVRTMGKLLAGDA